MYIANSAFEQDGAAYRPGDVLPELADASRLLQIGYIIAAPGAYTPATNAETEQPENADTDVKKIGRKK